MAIDKFSRQQFEDTLFTIYPGYESLGLVNDEEVYTLQANSHARLTIRSSVDTSGYAADSGEDSIRLWLQVLTPSLLGSTEWCSVGKKADAYTQRTKGWEKRLESKIKILWERLVKFQQPVELCPECQSVPRVFIVKKEGKNKNRPFVKCQDHYFQWLDEPLEKGSKVEFDESVEESCEVTARQVSSREINTTGNRVRHSAKPPDSVENAISSKPRANLQTLPQGFEQLNSYQQELIYAIAKGGTVIGEACPGSGKTRSLEMAVSTLVLNGADPSRIGVFTFSRKSAAEARRRIAQTILPDISPEELEYLETLQGDDVWGMFDEPKPEREMIKNWVCTIHALAYRLLKAQGQKVKPLAGQKKLRWDAEAIVKDGLKELSWNEGPKAVWAWIAYAINSLVEPESSFSFYQDALMNLGGPDRAYELSVLYQRYISYMNQHELVDFDMMQANVVKLIRNSQSFRDSLADMFDYVFIDEAQDNNSLQNEIILALTIKANLVMIGDVDQALYAFRGAKPEVLRSVEGVKLNLPINYRSTQSIIKASSQLISHSYQDDSQYLKPFQARPEAPEGNELSYAETEDFSSLTQEVIATIGEDYSGLAILSRTRAECAAIHTSLIAHGIPAINHSGGLLFGSPHIRKVLAYAMLACDYNGARDNLEILGEIANVASASFKAPITRRRHESWCDAKPWIDCGCTVIMQEGVDYSHSRFYGQKAIEKAGSWDGIIEQQWEVNKGNYPTLNSKGATDLVLFVRELEGVSNDAGSALSVIIQDCILPWLAAEEGLTEEDLAENGKAEDFELLLNLTEPSQTLEQFLDKIEWLSQASNQQSSQSNAVNIGTIHWSKGAEFERVIVNTTRLPIVPPQRREGALPVGRPATIAEERRLMFVAISRAKSECYLVGSRQWLDNECETSQFIGEIGL